MGRWKICKGGKGDLAANAAVRLIPNDAAGPSPTADFVPAARIGIVCLVLVAGLLQTGRSTAAPRFLEFVLEWGTAGTAAGEFDFPRGVETDASGAVYVVDRFLHRVQKFDAEGSFSLMWGQGVDTGDPTALEICTSGCQAGIPGSADGQLDDPTELAIDGQGNVYVADTGNHRVQKYGSDPGFLLAWGTTGGAEGQFSSPSGVAVGRDGRIYVSDRSNHRIQVFDDGGVFDRTFGWSVDDGGAEFQVCTSDCQEGTQGNGSGQFAFPGAVATAADGTVYVADRFNDRIQAFDANGGFLMEWGGPGTELGQLDVPTGIAVDSVGRVYVAEAENHRMHIFGPEGEAIVVFGWGVRTGTNEYEVCASGCQAGPVAFTTLSIAVDDRGNVYVTENDERILKFAGPFLQYFVG